MDTLNSVMSGEGEEEMAVLDRAKRFVVTVSLIEQSRITFLFISFIIFIIVFNTAFIVLVLASKAMRQSTRHVLIVGVCLGDLLLGLFVLPVLLDLRMRQGDDPWHCPTFYAMRLFADFLIPSITTLAMLMLNFDYLLRLSYSGYADGASRCCLLALLFMSPWVISCAVLIPLYIDALNSTQAYWWDTCNIAMGGYPNRTLLIISFFPQAVLLLLFNLTNAVLYLLRREYDSLDATGERLRAPHDLCFATFLTLLMYAPVFITALLNVEGYKGCEGPDQCGAMERLNTALVWFMFAKSWLLPFCWLACRDTRSCIRHIFDCC